MKTCLKKFENEVLDNGASACLPCNLSDEWLYFLNDSFESVYGDFKHVNLAAPIMAILTIMSFKSQKSEFFIDGNELKILIDSYRIEIAFEMVSRQTELEVNRADLQTIFTNRNIQFKQR